MNRIFWAVAAILMLGFSASPSAAGIYSDDLAKCMVSSATDSDKVELMRWVFSAFTANPSIKEMSSVTDEQQKVIDKDIAGLFTRLLLVDCHKEAVAAIKNEGANALEGSFNVLGQVAARSLATDPKTSSRLTAFAAYLDQDKWTGFGKETGVPFNFSAGK
jgi:hypothetical protein